MTGCGISGGTVPAGASGRISARQGAVLKEPLQLHPGHPTGLTPLSVETTIQCGINGGMGRGGADGKTLEPLAEEYVPHQELCHGEGTA
jgi:hypothetical protein